MERALFGAGCFWGVEASFRKIKGVIDTKVGYCGGHKDSPTYQDVCTDRTGHAEVVEIKFDPSQVTFEQLLDAFWNLHDPTTRNRQGPDIGSQYRSVVFYCSPQQKEAAERGKASLAESKKFSGPIVTEIVPAATFYPAEEYHQRYLEKQGKDSCHI